MNKELDKSSMLYWWPKVKDLGIPVPRTEIVEIPFEDLIKSLDEQPLKEQYTSGCIEAGIRIGYPLFLRTDMSSAKHSWIHTCYVPDRENLLKHIWSLIDSTLAMGMFGELDPNALVFRELLRLDSSFTAFSGLPISSERRYFIRDGKVECHHSYWIQYAIERSWKTPSEEDWIELLEDLNKETEAEVDILTSYAEMVSKVLPEYWSVDFALDKSKSTWYLIDMAVGKASWHPEHIDRTGEQYVIHPDYHKPDHA